MTLKVLHLSTFDSIGGAGRAAYSLHSALLDAGVDSRMRVGIKQTTDHTVTAGSHWRQQTSRALDRQLRRLQISSTTTWRSPARFSSFSASEINSSGADIINLHWITDGFLSIEEIGRVRIPIAWSMYDMWPFAGAEHYGISDSPRWRHGYTRFNRPTRDVALDVDRWTFERKVRHWRNIKETTTLIPASRWLERSVLESNLMHDWSVSRIPHVVDCDLFNATDRTSSRAQLDIRVDAPLVLFSASAGIQDHRKGWDLLEQALNEIAKTQSNIHALVVGPLPDQTTRERVARRSRATILWHRPTDTNQELRRLISAADVVAVPSREDNMPLSAMEAQTCGRPVVGFKVGGLPDIVDHLESGYLAYPLDSRDLARGLALALTDTTGSAWADRARARAIATWSAPVVAEKYLDLYWRALKTRG